MANVVAALTSMDESKRAAQEAQGTSTKGEDTGQAAHSRLLIVSNRLPFTVNEEGGKLGFVPSSGGLVSGLTGYLERLGSETPAQVEGDANVEPGQLPYIWIGWPGATVPRASEDELKRIALSQFSAYPVYVDESAMENFYHGFCNKTIWPLFHYFSSFTEFQEDYWEEYKAVNRTFADAVVEIARPGDTIWVHDYQLMLLPRLIRERIPDASIGFFLHIPFPGYEIFRLLPREWAVDILEGMLGADLVGFHTHEYTQYFARTVLRELGYEQSLGEMLVGDRLVKTDTFPMGIDYNHYHDAVATPEVQREKRAVTTSLRGAKMVLSLDRLDYTKGIINRLEGFERFLDKYPEWHEKVTLVLAIVPSRVAVERYQDTREQIEGIVGRITGKFGSITWTPVTYQYRAVPFPMLIALYNTADVALITPLRDGMNLIAKEYVAACNPARGMLILSEFAGAVKELGEAVIINPNSREEIANALKEALDMPQDERARRIELMQERLQRYNVSFWAEDFIHQLSLIKESQSKFEARLLSADTREQLLADYRHATHRLLLLDYDGTLVPFEKDPQQAVPGVTVLDIISRLCAMPGNDVVVISGRDRATLQAWLGDLPVGLVAEHGMWLRKAEPGAKWRLVQHLNNDWKPSIRPVLELYANRLPGSFIEEKDYSLAWHYRAADPDLGPARAKELLDYLVNYTSNIPVQVLQGNKVLEVKTARVNKGTTGLQWLGSDNFDFVLAIGDDWTDEHLFMSLPKDAYTVRVGLVQSYARYNLRNYSDVIGLLEQLALEA